MNEIRIEISSDNTCREVSYGLDGVSIKGEGMIGFAGALQRCQEPLKSATKTGKIWNVLWWLLVYEDLNCRIIGFEPEKMGWNTKNRMLTITKLGGCRRQTCLDSTSKKWSLKFADTNSSGSKAEIDTEKQQYFILRILFISSSESSASTAIELTSLLKLL